MGKKARNKKLNADKIFDKRSKPAEIKLNPFEIHVNKEKHAVLNRKLKTNQGMPGKSRDKAFKRRLETIGVEYAERNRQNRFNDTRNVSGRQHKRTTMYNLNEHEVLTHKGQTLEQIERFEAPEQDHDEDDEARLNAEFTEAAHFGGEGQDRKSAIAELIAESKRLKQERVEEGEKVFALTQTIDDKWKNLSSLMQWRTEEVHEKADDYDRAKNALKFESCGVPTNALKSAAEQARLDREKAVRMEIERKKRMQSEGENKPTHRSADDLDDGYFLDEDEGEGERMVAYDIEAPEESVDIAEEPQEDAEEPESEEESSEEEEEEDRLSDLKDSESEEEEVPEPTPKKMKIETLKKPQVEAKKDEKDEETQIYKIPESYPDFADILDGKSSQERGKIIESMMKNVQLFIAGQRKEKLIALFAFMLQHINDMFGTATVENIKENFRHYNKLVPHLYTLNQQYPDETSRLVIGVVHEKQENFRKKSKFFPDLDTIIFFKLISVLFSTSDFRHPVVTPTVIFLGQILRARVIGRKDLSLGLFLCTVYLEYCQLSRRFLPEVLNFLNRVLALCSVSAAPKKGANLLVLERKSKFTAAKLDAEDLVSTELTEEFKVKALGMSLGLIGEYLKLYTDLHALHCFVQNCSAQLKQIDQRLYSKEMRKQFEQVTTQCEELRKTEVAILVERAKKPKTLRLLEPKIVKVYDGHKRSEVDHLRHKIRREKKGAVRDIRRDNEFLTKLKFKKQMEGDRERKEKVKAIFAEASTQLGELNSMEKKRNRLKDKFK